MTLTKAILTILLAMSLGGCSRWAVERHEAETASRIDERLQSGMTIADFNTNFPGATKLDSVNNEETWLVTVQEVCFWCHSGRGFRESKEVFARVVSFNNGVLAGVLPVAGARP